MRSSIGWPNISFTNKVLTGLFLLVLGTLIWFSLHLGAVRFLQVDECCNVFSARMLASGQARTILGKVDLFQVCLSWLMGGASRSIDLFSSGRFVMLELFWLNMLLIALASGGRVLSAKGLVSLFAASTLAPLWDYGFEIRHDNLLLAGVLLIWCGARANQPRLQSYFVAGGITVALQFVAFKAFVYTVPLCAALLIFPPPGIKAARSKLVSLWIGGAVTALIIVRLIYGAEGIWDLCVNSFRWYAGASTSGNRFGPWITLNRLLEQTPLLLALLVSALIAMGLELKNRGRSALTWNGLLPETFLFSIGVGALVINPTPYPYNLLHLVPYGFLLAFRHAAALWEELVARMSNKPTMMPTMVSIFVFIHIIPFAVATKRHLDRPISRQEKLMAMAEQLTDSIKDPVYDAIGLVPTRSIVHPTTFLHAVQSHLDGPGSKWSELMLARPATVMILSYRTYWLSEKDQNFIRERYVPLSDDFWVLGKMLPPGGGSIEIIHPGRYYIGPLRGSNIAGTYKEDMQELLHPVVDPPLNGMLDGKPMPQGPVELTKGPHEIASNSQSQVAVVWVGPSLNNVPRLGSGNRLDLFVNWY